MAPAPVLASLTCLGTALSPTPNALLLSEDGQILIATRSEVNILTPALGMQGDKPTDRVKEAGASVKGKEKERSEMPLFRTTLSVEKKQVIDWGGWVNELEAGTAAGGMLDKHWRSASWSPTGLGPLGGCVLALLTNNCEVQVYEPGKNMHKAEWTESYDLTSHLVRLVLPEDPDDKGSNDVETAADRQKIVRKLSECQSTALAWSTSVESSLGDLSILVVGYRSGHIALWRRTMNGEMEILHRFRMAERANWITMLTWTPWSISDTVAGKVAMACLAVGDADGRVWSVEIVQKISTPLLPLSAIPSDPIYPDTNPEDDVWAVTPIEICQMDRRSVTQFRWIIRGAIPELLYTKLGMIRHVQLQSADANVTSNFTLLGIQELMLPTVGDWMGATAFDPCAGIEYLPDSQTIILVLADGSFHSITLDPHLAFADGSVVPTSAQLTQTVREHFLTVGKKQLLGKVTAELHVKKVDWKQGPLVKGLASFGLDGELGWIFSAVRPDSLHYRADSSNKTLFAVVSLFGDDTVESHVAHLAKVLAQVQNARLRSPLDRLRSTLHFVEDRLSNFDVSTQLLAFLQLCATIPAPNKNVILPLHNRVDFAFAMLGGLFGDPHLEALRGRETVARFMLRHPSLPHELHRDLLVLHTALAREIAKAVTGFLGSCLNAINSLLTPQELSISGRLLMASSALPEVPPPGPDDPIFPPDALTSSFVVPETCPACREPIALVNIRNAVCPNGHKWERCSITLTVIASVKVRTCTGCERKALLELPAPPKPAPTSAENGEVAPEVAEAEAEVTRAMLKLATCCLYCGGRWQRIR